MGNCLRAQDDHARLLPLTASTRPSVVTVTTSDNSVSMPKVNVKNQSKYIIALFFLQLIAVNRQTDINIIKAAQSRNLFEHLPLVNYNEKLVKQTEYTAKFSLIESHCVLFSFSSCAICLIDFLPNEQIRQLPCDGGHVFHPTCIDSWLEKSLTCPHCSINVDAVLLLKFIPKSTHDDDDD